MTLKSKSSRLTRVVAALLLISLALATSPAPSSAYKQLDNKVRELFNQKTSLKNAESVAKLDGRLHLFTYESGLKVTLAQTAKGIEVSSYEQGGSARSASASRWQKDCTPAQPRRLTQQEVEVYLRKIGEFGNGFSVISFKVGSEGYVIELGSASIVILVELDWNLVIRRKSTRSVQVIPQPTQNASEVDSQTRQSLITFCQSQIRATISLKVFQVLNIQRISSGVYKIVVLITFRIRQIRYEIIVREVRSQAYDIEQASFNLGFTPAFEEYTEWDLNLVKGLDLLVKDRVAGKTNKRLDGSAKITKIWRDEPFYRFFYLIGSEQYVILFTFEPFKKVIDIVNIKVTEVAKPIPTVQPIPIVQPVITVQPSPSPKPSTEQVDTKTRDQLLGLLQSRFQVNFGTGNEINKITRLSANRYLVIITFMIRQRRLQYELTLNLGAANKFEVEDSKCNIQFKPVYTRAKADQSNEGQLIRELDILVRKSIAAHVPASASLTMIESDEPFYKFLYIYQNIRYEIQFNYDLFTRRVNLLNAKQTIVEQQQPLAPNYVLPSGPATPGKGQHYTEYTEYQYQYPAQAGNSLVKPKYEAEINKNEYSAIPAGLFTELTSQDDGLVVELASIALEKILPEIQQIDAKFSLSKKYYYLKSEHVYIFKFLIDTKVGIITYYYELTLETADSYTETTSTQSTSQQIQQTGVVSGSANNYTMTQQSTTVGANAETTLTVPAKVQQSNQGSTITTTEATVIKQLPNSEPLVAQPQVTLISEPQAILVSEPQVTQPSEPATVITSQEANTQVIEQQIIQQTPQPILITSQPQVTNQVETTIVQTQTVPLISTPQPVATSAPGLVLPSAETAEQSLLSGLVAYSEQQLRGAYTFVTQQARGLSFSNCRIYRAQKFSYGFRLILVIDRIYYQFVIRTLATGQYQLLTQQEVKPEEADQASLDAYTSVQVDEQLQALLLRALPKDRLGAVKRVISCRLRISVDGFYYQVVLETESTNQYTIVVYYKPEEQFSEILSYEHSNSQYYLSIEEARKYTEEQVDLQAPTSETLAVFEFVEAKFGASFSSASVVYVYRTWMTAINVSLFRMAVRTASGVFYEVTVAAKGSDLFIIRYIKLFDGYSLATSQDESIRAAFQFCTQSISSKVDASGMQLENVLVREITNVGRLYRFIMVGRTRFSVLVFVDIRSNMAILGMASVPSYYTYFLSKITLYGELSFLIQNIRVYLQPKVVISQPVHVQTQVIGYYDANYDFNCLKVEGNRCLKCAWRFYLQDGQCLKVPDPCKQYVAETGVCVSCFNGFYLSSSGSCITSNTLCLASDDQGRCTQCYNDYQLINGQCYRVATYSSNLRRQALDPLCESFASTGLCVKCTPGTYMSRKLQACAFKDPFLDQFDEVNEIILRCVRGYSVVDNKCVRNA